MKLSRVSSQTSSLASSTNTKFRVHIALTKYTFMSFHCCIHVFTESQTVWISQFSISQNYCLNKFSLFLEQRGGSRNLYSVCMPWCNKATWPRHCICWDSSVGRDRLLRVRLLQVRLLRVRLLRVRLLRVLANDLVRGSSRGVVLFRMRAIRPCFRQTLCAVWSNANLCSFNVTSDSTYCPSQRYKVGFHTLSISEIQDQITHTVHLRDTK